MITSPYSNNGILYGERRSKFLFSHYISGLVSSCVDIFSKPCPNHVELDGTTSQTPAVQVIATAANSADAAKNSAFEKSQNNHLRVANAISNCLEMWLKY